MPMLSINPATGQTIQSFPTWQSAEIDATLSQVTSAQIDWAALSFAQRSNCMRNLAKIFRQRSEEYANLITEEMQITQRGQGGDRKMRNGLSVLCRSCAIVFKR